MTTPKDTYHPLVDDFYKTLDESTPAPKPKNPVMEGYQSALGGKNILLVDDNTNFREFMEYMLETVGCNVIPKTDGKQALDYMLSEDSKKINAIVTDNNMPNMEGIDFLSNMIRDKYGGLENYIRSPMFTILHSGNEIDDCQFETAFGKPNAQVPNLVTLMKPYSNDTLYKTLADGINSKMY